MSAHVELLKLVDQALCHPEKGAVNFNHLRKLLLEIVKLLQKNSVVLVRLDNPASHKARAASKDDVSSKDNNVSRRSDSSCAKDQTGSHSHQDKEDTRVVKDKTQLEIKSDKPEQSIDAIDHLTGDNEKSKQNVENEALDEVHVEGGEEDHENDEGIGGISNQTSEDNVSQTFYCMSCFIGFLFFLFLLYLLLIPITIIFWLFLVFYLKYFTVHNQMT